MKKARQILNPAVFVHDENNPYFVAHIEWRVKKAQSGKGILSKETFMRRLDDRLRELKNAEIYRQV